MSFSGDDSLIWWTVDSGTLYENPTDKGLGRVFIYYYPQYDVIKDTIEVNNAADIKFQCYALKQRADDIKEADLQIKENGYKPEIKASGSASGAVELFHNFDYNIGTFVDMSWGKTPTGFSKVHSYKDDSTAFVEDVEDTSTILSYTLDLEITRSGAAKSSVKLQSTMNEKMK